MTLVLWLIQQPFGGDFCLQKTVSSLLADIKSNLHTHMYGVRWWLMGKKPCRRCLIIHRNRLLLGSKCPLCRNKCFVHNYRPDHKSSVVVVWQTGRAQNKLSWDCMWAPTYHLFMLSMWHIFGVSPLLSWTSQWLESTGLIKDINVDECLVTISTPLKKKKHCVILPSNGFLGHCARN